MMPQDQAQRDRLESRFGAGVQPEAAPKKVWPYHEQVGMHPRFKGKQEVRVSRVGDCGPEHALIEVWDTKDGALAQKSDLTILGEQLEQVLVAMLKAEEVEADLAFTPAEHRPEFPIPIGEIPGSKGSIRVYLDQYHDRIQVKVSHSVPGRRTGGGWLSVSVEDVQPIGSMLLQVLKSFPAAEGGSAPLSEEEMAF